MDNVSKTVRLPPELVSYVDSQEGNNFSSKLISVLEEYKSGEQIRSSSISYYDRAISERRKKLNEVTDDLYKASNLLRRITSALNDVDSDI
jgi:hypothetical protein